MLRVVVGVSAIVMLVSTYMVNPIIGWFALGTLVMFMLIKRSRRGSGNVAVRDALRALK